MRLAWPTGQWGDMPVPAGVEAEYGAEIAAAEDPVAKRKEVTESFAAQMSMWRTVKKFGVEEVIDPRETRAVLGAPRQGGCEGDRAGTDPRPSGSSVTAPGLRAQNGRRADERWPGPFGDELRSLVRENLRRLKRRPIRLTAERRRAGVAVAVLESDSEPAVLMIKRSDLGRHPGQWAFPGGAVEPGERTAAAALREAWEEVGLERAEVVGVLDDILTGTGFIITPIVVFVEAGARLRRMTDEVHSLHRVGLARLIAPAMPSWARNDSGPEVLQYRLRHDMVVHAPSGAILWQFAEVALRGRPTRVAKLRQPEFALQ